MDSVRACWREDDCVVLKVRMKEDEEKAANDEAVCRCFLKSFSCM